MRRRRGGTGDDEMGEALLPEGAEASEAPLAAPPPRQQQHQLIVHRPFDLEAFLLFIWQRWTALLQAIGGCLCAILGRPSTPKLSLVQASRLEELQGRVGVPYEPDNTLHQEALLELWSLANPGVPCPGLKGPHWKAMGWQGVDPATDFRAAGLLGLDCLLYLGRTQPLLFKDLQNKARGKRSDWEYPFGAAGMNVAWMLVELLQLQPAGAGGVSGSSSSRGPTATPAGRGFLGLLAAHDAAFEEVFCATYDALDREWVARGASYMEFNSVLGDVKGQLGRALAGRPGDVAALRRALGLPG